MSVGSSCFTLNIPFNVDAPGTTGVAVDGRTVLHQTWSHSDSAILAVATSDGHVQLFSEEDDNITLVQTLTRTSRRTTLVTSPPLPPQSNSTGPIVCKVMAWHPFLPLLITCWEDGGMSVWLEGRGLVADESPERINVPSVITFAASGSRFIVGDVNGQATLCQLDSKLKITALRRFVRQSAITHAVFRLGGVPGTVTEGLPGPTGGFGSNLASAHGIDEVLRTAASGATASTSNNPESNCFFFATRAGTLFYVNESFVCSELGSLNVNIISLHYDPPSSTLYVIGANASFAVLTLSREGKVLNERRAKLSGVTVPISGAIEAGSAGGAKSTGFSAPMQWKMGELQLVWVGRSTLVIANGESVVRVWHLNDDETYTLSLASVSSEVAQEKICHVAFDSANRTLVTITLEGTAVLWRHLAKAITTLRSDSTGKLAEQWDAEKGEGYDAGTSAAGADMSGSHGASESTPSPADWEPLPSNRVISNAQHLSTDAVVTGLATSSKDGLISATIQSMSNGAITGPCTMIALKRGHLARSCRDGLTAVQSTPESVLLVRPTAAVLAVSTDTITALPQTQTSGLTVAAAPGVVDITPYRLSAGSSILLQGQPSQSELLWRPGFRVRGLDSRGDIAVAFGAKRLEIVDVSSGSVAALGSFGHSGIKHFALGDQTLYMVSGSRIDFYTFGGVVRNSIELNVENEGAPVRVDVSASGVLLCLTSRGIIKTWDVSRREVRPLLQGRSLTDDEALIKEVSKFLPPTATTLEEEKGALDSDLTIFIQQVALSAQGQRVAFTVVASRGASIPSVQPFVAVYDVEQDSVYVDHTPVGTIPVNLCWDAKQPLLLGYEAAPLRSTEASAQRAITTVFFSANTSAGAGLFVQERFTIANDSETLVGLAVPYVYVLSWRLSSQQSGGGASDAIRAADANTLRRPFVCKRVLRDFAGLDEADEETHADLMQFSYYLALGLIDDAHHAVQRIQAAAVWRSMAAMSVRTRRVDVARLCLSHMQDARAAWLMRDAISRNDALPPCSLTPDSDDSVKASDGHVGSRGASSNPKKVSSNDLVQLGTLACILGMESEAEQLYREAGRLDLLTELLDIQGRSGEAVQLCQKESKVLLPAVQYMRAERLKLEGKLPQALALYCASGAAVSEIPRLLHDTADPLVARAIDEIAAHSSEAGEPLLEWAGNHHLARRRYGEAMQCFSKTSRTDRMVFAYVRRGQLDKAEALCKQTNDPSACLALARQFESKENVEKAVEYYVRAKRYAQGVRLCKEHRLTSMLQRLALEGPPSVQLEAATFFEENGQIEQAVMLYQRGGNPARAVELCFSAKLFGHLKTIVENIGHEADPALLARCADFFLMNGEYARAAHLLVNAGKLEQALDLCFKHSIPFDEELAEKLSPPKVDNASEAEKQQRKTILLRIAEACRDQGLYQVACKKFTQAGDPIRAIQCLIKSGDTEKICYYAQRIKSREVHILAARYLEHLNWREDPEIMRRIVQFYTLAKAHEALFRFYDLCAHYEIDEFRSYEKAQGAMTEAHKWLVAARNANAPNISDVTVASYEQKLRLVEQFVKVRQLAQTDPEAMVRGCEALIAPALSTPDAEAGLRAGDVYALLVEYYHRRGNNQAAFDSINRMRNDGIILGPYLDGNLVRAILSACGRPSNYFDSEFARQGHDNAAIGAYGQQGVVEEEGLEEEIGEEIFSG